MSRWFFHSEERQETLGKEMEEWMGTPFRHAAGVKKVGADCIHFALVIYDIVGAVKNAIRYMPYYGHDWCMHTSEQKLYKGISKHPSFQEVGFKNPMNGDLMLYQFGLAASHCGIYFDGNIYQSINLIGVHKMLYIDKMWHRRRVYNFRVKNV